MPHLYREVERRFVLLLFQFSVNELKV